MPPVRRESAACSYEMLPDGPIQISRVNFEEEPQEARRSSRTNFPRARMRPRSMSAWSDISRSSFKMEERYLWILYIVLTFAVPCQFIPAHPMRPSRRTVVFLNFYVFRIWKFRRKTNIRLVYWSRFSLISKELMKSRKKEEKTWRISTSRQEVWLIWAPNGNWSIGDYLTRPGKKFATPNQNVLVTRLFSKSMRKCCAEEYAESWVNIHHIYRNIQIITSQSASKDCTGRPGLNEVLIEVSFNIV
jgi:hypothetical protein